MSATLGLSHADLQGSFREIFESVLAPRLGHREAGFRAIFENLNPAWPTIVETGCLRALGNWVGDGQSTFLFDLFARKTDGALYSIDANHASLETAARVCHRAKLIGGDGATEIHRLVVDRLSRNPIDVIDLLYLDSFDHGRDVSVIPAPVHYALELTAAWPKLKAGSLVAIDDFYSPEVPGLRPTKGLAVETFMQKVGAEVLHDGYQKVWVIR